MNKKLLIIVGAMCCVFVFQSVKLYAAWDSLGANVSSDGTSTTFSIWSPNSSNVWIGYETDSTISVNLLGNLDSMNWVQMNGPNSFTDEYGNSYDNIYSYTVQQNLHQCAYQFSIDSTNVRDPYARMVAGPNTTNQIANQNATPLRPAVVIDWNQIDYTIQPVSSSNQNTQNYVNRSDAVIYESHIMDFTMSNGTSGAQTNGYGNWTIPGVALTDMKESPYSGTFLAMAQSGTSITYNETTVSTGLDHLAQLGITHIQILPFFSFAFYGYQYNLGYNPLNYNVPETNYSAILDTSVNYSGRIVEVMQMINNFHEAGIRVVMGVVYNHTTSYDVFNPNNVISQYYDDAINTGGLPPINYNNPMVANMIRDSFEFWAAKYQVDGFRIDMMQAYPVSVISTWTNFLYEKFPDLLMYGECFSGNQAYLGDISSSEVMLDGTLTPGVGGFNWPFKQGLVGSPFGAAAYGFLFNGVNPGGSNWYPNLDCIESYVKGSIRQSSNQSSNSVPNNSINENDLSQFANMPAESINYTACHDGLTTYDAIQAWAAAGTCDNLPQVAMFAGGILATSQGIPFYFSGDEMLRTIPAYSPSPNSNVLGYCANHDFAETSSFGSINVWWPWKVLNNNTYNYFKKMINMRTQHPAFSMSTWNEINNNVSTFQAANAPGYSTQNGYAVSSNSLNVNVVGAVINGSAVNDNWTNIIVIYNPSLFDYTYTISDPSRSYTVFTDMWDTYFGITPTPYTKNSRSIGAYSNGDVVHCPGPAVTIMYTID